MFLEQALQKHWLFAKGQELLCASIKTGPQNTVGILILNLESLFLLMQSQIILTFWEDT